jgi:hypothetical protein
MDRIGAVMGLAGLVLLFSSCEKEIADGHSEGKVPVIFTINNADYAAGEAEIRGFGAREPETKVIPLGDDLYLYATLKEADELRGQEEPLVANQRVFLEAYTPGGTTPIATAKYTYIGGKLVADDDAPLGVEAGTYDFIAYSFYKSDEDPATASVDPIKDLVWGRQANRTIGTASDAARTVTIKMAHKLARAKVNMKVSGISGATITALNVQLEGGKRVTLTKHNGNVSPVADVTQTFSWSALSVSEVSGIARTVYPVGSPAKITIVGMTMRIGATNYTISNQPIEFSTALNVGTSYVLEVNLKHTRWAGSNIYWDGARMTFDVTHTNTKYYQGVGFFWGSLVGISPMTAATNNITLYLPTGGGNWNPAPTTVGSSAWGSFGSIPYTTATSATNATSENFLYNQTLSTYTGDICKYIDPAWRMPNADEFGSASNYSSWNNGTTSSNAAGTGMVTAGRTYTAGSVFLPGGGYQSAGAALEANMLGAYWSGSAYNSTNGRCLTFGSSDIFPSNYKTRLMALFVRCIKAN